MELWTHAYSAPRGIMQSAKIAEDGGWDGISVVDSQNLSGDAFVALAMAATRRLGTDTEPEPDPGSQTVAVSSPT